MKKTDKISLLDIEITHVKGSGPGGQNRNKRMSGIRARHIPTGITAMATERRSQAQNLGSALLRLSEKLAIYFYRPETRYATEKTRSSIEKRIGVKKKKSGIKNTRKKKIGFDD